MESQYVALDTAHKASVGLERVADSASQMDVLVVGEFHDDPVAHRVEHALLNLMIHKRGSQPPSAGGKQRPTATDSTSACPVSSHPVPSSLRLGFTGARSMWDVLHTDPSAITGPAPPAAPRAPRTHQQLSTADTPPRPNSTPPRMPEPGADAFHALSTAAPSMLTAAAVASAGSSGESYSGAAAQTAAAAAVRPMLRSAYEWGSRSFTNLVSLVNPTGEGDSLHDGPAGLHRMSSDDIVDSAHGSDDGMSSHSATAAAREPLQLSATRSPLVHHPSSHPDVSQYWVWHARDTSAGQEPPGADAPMHLDSTQYWTWHARDTSVGNEAEVVLTGLATPTRRRAPARNATELFQESTANPPSPLAPSAGTSSLRHVPASMAPSMLHIPKAPGITRRASESVLTVGEPPHSSNDPPSGHLRQVYSNMKGNSCVSAATSVWELISRKMEDSAADGTQPAAAAASPPHSPTIPAVPAPRLAQVACQGPGPHSPSSLEERAFEPVQPPSESCCDEPDLEGPDAARRGVAAGAALASHPRPLVLSLEMFERDVQCVLDEYCTGAIPEADLLKDARPWPTYLSDYRALVETARQHRVPVIASNAPRRHVALVGRFGPTALLQRLPQPSAAHLPPLQLTPVSEQLRTMVLREFRKRAQRAGGQAAAGDGVGPSGAGGGQGAGGVKGQKGLGHGCLGLQGVPLSEYADVDTHGLALARGGLCCDFVGHEAVGGSGRVLRGWCAPRIQLDNQAAEDIYLGRYFFDAQAVWDATMAHSVARALQTVKSCTGVAPTIMHVCGHFHMAHGLGIPERLQQYAPGCRVLLVAVVPTDEHAFRQGTWKAWQHYGAEEEVLGTGHTMAELTSMGDFVVLTDGGLPRTFAYEAEDEPRSED